MTRSAAATPPNGIASRSGPGSERDAGTAARATIPAPLGPRDFALGPPAPPTIGRPIQTPALTLERMFYIMEAWHIPTASLLPLPPWSAGLFRLDSAQPGVQQRSVSAPQSGRFQPPRSTVPIPASVRYSPSMIASSPQIWGLLYSNLIRIHHFLARAGCLPKIRAIRSLFLVSGGAAPLLRSFLYPSAIAR